MTNFEFVFSLLVIILGLGLAEVFGGFARVAKRGDTLQIGWGTGLLATWVITETVIFWEIIWRSRDALPSDSSAMFPGVAVTGLYYFAGALCFPEDFDRRTSLDDYFLRSKWKTIAAVLAAVALAFVWRRMVMGPAGWAVVPAYAWAGLAVMYIAGPIAMLTRSRKIAVAALAVLVLNDLLDPILWIIWPD